LIFHFPIEIFDSEINCAIKKCGHTHFLLHKSFLGKCLWKSIRVAAEHREVQHSIAVISKDKEVTSITEVVPGLFTMAKTAEIPAIDAYQFRSTRFQNLSKTD